MSVLESKISGLKGDAAQLTISCAARRLRKCAQIEYISLSSHIRDSTMFEKEDGIESVVNSGVFTHSVVR